MCSSLYGISATRRRRVQRRRLAELLEHHQQAVLRSGEMRRYDAKRSTGSSPSGAHTRWTTAPGSLMPGNSTALQRKHLAHGVEELEHVRVAALPRDGGSRLGNWPRRRPGEVGAALRTPSGTDASGSALPIATAAKNAPLADAVDDGVAPAAQRRSRRAVEVAVAVASSWPARSGSVRHRVRARGREPRGAAPARPWPAAIPVLTFVPGRTSYAQPVGHGGGPYDGSRKATPSPSRRFAWKKP